MKTNVKISTVIFTVLTSTLLMTGCSGTVSKEGDSVSKNEIVVEYTEEHVSSGGLVSHYGHISDVRHFEYNGHSYIQFDISSTHSGRSGIVHDPDCSCHNSQDIQL